MSEVTLDMRNQTARGFVVPLTAHFDPTEIMAQEKEDRMLGLSPAQVAGSALAAVSGALLASFAGTTGTIIGTAVGSVVATVGGALYTWSLKRSSAAVRRTAAQVRSTALLTGPLPRTVVQGPMRSKDGTGPPTPSEVEAESAEAEAAADAEPESAARALPWRKLALASLAVTVLALGGITTFEALTGKPIASLVGGDDSQGTSVGNLVRPSDDTSSEDRTPSEDPTAPTEEESQEPDPDTEPTEVPEVPVPSVTPSPDSTLPSDQPSAAPGDGLEGAPAAQPGAQPGSQPGSETDPAP